MHERFSRFFSDLTNGSTSTITMDISKLIKDSENRHLFYFKSTLSHLLEGLSVTIFQVQKFVANFVFVKFMQVVHMR